MTNVLALDISSKPGWALYVDGKLSAYDTIFNDKTVEDFGLYPANYVLFAEDVADKIIRKINCYSDLSPTIVIEETTASRNNLAQRRLEWIHFLVCDYCTKKSLPIAYIRTGVWRNYVGAHQNKEERNHNAKVLRIKKKTGKKIAKIDGKRTRKLDRKDYAIRAFKEIFGVELDRKMEDACDAALLGLAYLKRCPICDGSIFGGTLPKATHTISFNGDEHGITKQTF